MMKTYFISYSHANGSAIGFGCCNIQRKKRIKTGNDIVQLASDIQIQLKNEHYPIKNIVILNYKRMWF